MENRERPTIFERLLEMVRGRGGATDDRPKPGSRKAERDQSEADAIARKEGRKRKKAAAAS